MPEAPSNLEVVTGYHEATKHHYNRFARSLGYMDWETQPNPFRCYAGAETVALPLACDDGQPLYDSLFAEVSIRPGPIDLASIGRFFQHALGLSASKEYQGTRWELRCNPSSGNLHPTEGYLVTGPIEGLCSDAAVFHYAPKAHALELRRSFAPALWQQLTDSFPDTVFFAGLTSIHWREAWKYGERAYRYCQHDVGHALGAYAMAAAAFGWRARVLEGLSDGDLTQLLGLPPADPAGSPEPECPDLLVAITPDDGPLPGTLPQEGIEAIGRVPLTGEANALSREHVVDWEIIEAVDRAAAKPRTEPLPEKVLRHYPPLPSQQHAHSAWQIFQQRRSAVSMDGESRMEPKDFFTALDRLLPDRPVPWGAFPYRPAAHLALFVHRVVGLDPGLYCMPRTHEGESLLRDAFRGDFDWERPASCPERLPLYLLKAGDFRAQSAQVSCGQAIASDGAFSLGMIAEFAPVLQREGPWAYRRLFWEAGLIGQVLYLEAEAAGLRGTGIGCYFDDPMHKLLGLKDRQFQSMYHFTVGGPVEDPRLRSLPPYADL